MLLTILEFCVHMHMCVLCKSSAIEIFRLQFPGVWIETTPLRIHARHWWNTTKTSSASYSGVSYDDCPPSLLHLILLKIRPWNLGVRYSSCDFLALS
ncbi:hypothetical protein KC19_VG030500 [Ceratodon purpureus]|uniref:Uncharacterized protein n=1 Tax=Ceratodon purpureus TaxID=3225 RepID=A0A8T0HLF0_CERPU|nr:hypothetical protein KC19_VG030500 [Ceratodon purpureus]